MWAAIGDNEGLVQEGSEIIANTAGAVATAWKQVQAAVEGNRAAIQQEMQARVNADGTITAKITFKIDNNGYITGWGLISESNNAIPRSKFIIRSDDFYWKSGRTWDNAGRAVRCCDDSGRTERQNGSAWGVHHRCRHCQTVSLRTR